MDAADLSIVHRLDAIEAAAYRDMFTAAPDGLSASLKLETREVAGATLLMAPGLPTPMFNRVIGLGNSQAPGPRDLERITASYRDAGIKSWWIHVSPGVRPESLTATLAAQGFVPPPRKAWVKVLRDNTPPRDIDTGLEVRPIRPGEELAMAETLCVAFDMPAMLAPWYARLPLRPDWRAVGAFDHGAMVGCGLLHFQDHHAWLGAGGVRPEARGRHVHRALMNLRIRIAIDAGCTGITTETGEPVGDEPNPSLRNMEACGFRKICSRLNYAAPA